MSCILREIDMIYIINLKNRNDRKERILKLLDGLSIERTKIKFIDAINGKLKHNIADYERNIEKIRLQQFANNQKGFELFIKWSYQPGAYGCLISHMKAIEDAKKNGYHEILILEDDITFKSSLVKDIDIVMKFVPHDWDFLYLGKKQGEIDIIDDNLPYCPYDLPYHHHRRIGFSPSSILHNIEDTISNVVQTIEDHLPYRGPKRMMVCHPNNIKNTYWYKPNIKTWASHAWMIKDTIFDALLEAYKTQENAVDILVHRLFNQYNFYVVKEDLFITSYDSDIREEIEYEKEIHYQKWGWNINDYIPFKSVPTYISKVIIFGFHNDTRRDHTHTYIHRAIYETFKKIFPRKIIYHAHDNQAFILNHFKNSLVFCSPAQDERFDIPKDDSNIYLVHIDQNTSYNLINQYFRKEIDENRVLFITCREYDHNLYFKEDHTNEYGIRTLCLPWAAGFVDHSTILSYINKINDLPRIRFHQNQEKNIVFFGSVWSLTHDIVVKIAEISKKNNYNFTIIGRLAQGYYKDIIQANPKVNIKTFHDYKNDPNITDEYSSLIPENSLVLTLQGDEHTGNYLSCRVFNNIANMHFTISNNPISTKMVKHILYNDNVEALIQEAFELNLEEYKIRLGKQLIDVYFNHTYQNRIFEYLENLDRMLSVHNVKFPNKPIEIDRNISQLYKKYILVIAFQRTGSSYLCDALNDFSNIYGAQEIYQSDKLGLNYDNINEIRSLYQIESHIDNESTLKHPKIIQDRDLNHYTNILKHVEASTKKPIIAFKIFPNHNINITSVYELLSFSNTIPIILKRNFIDIYISHRRAKTSNQYAGTKYDQQKIIFDKAEFEMMYYMYQNWYDLIEKYLQSKSINYHVIEYEKDILNNDLHSKIKEIVEITDGIDIGDLIEKRQSDFIKQGEDNVDYETIIENYADFKIHIESIL